MSEYKRSPQPSAYRGYIRQVDRTSAWVSGLPRDRPVDPAMPPSDTESAFYSDSDTESSRSTPPRFVLRFPDGREERVSDNYSNPSLNKVRSRAASGPAKHHGPPPSHHHSRSMSMHPSTRASGPFFRPPSSHTMPPPEDIRILPPQRAMTPGIAGYVNSRSTQAHHHGPKDKWTQMHGPPEAIKFSHSHPPSKHDGRGHPANPYRHRSSSNSRQSVIASPSSHMSQLTKENTIANSHSRIRSRVPIEDGWLAIDEDEELEREKQRTAYRRGRVSSQSSSSSPPLSYSRSRTTSSSSRSGSYPPGPQIFVSFVS
jgi:hypothetical protein